MINQRIEEKTEMLLKNNNLFQLIDGIGIDIQKLIRMLGVNLISKKFTEDISGLFVMTEENIPIISYNSEDNEVRKRFTMAHELGHFILHSKDQSFFIDKSPKVFFRNSVSTTGEKFMEREANSFAAALLMPSHLISSELATCTSFGNEDDTIFHLARRFMVSQQALAFRLSNLGLSSGLFD